MELHIYAVGSIYRQICSKHLNANLYIFLGIKLGCIDLCGSDKIFRSYKSEPDL